MTTWIEVVKEIPHGTWHKRVMISPDLLDLHIMQDHKAAWYRSSFILHGQLSGNISKDFDILPKSGDLFFDFDSSDILKSQEDCRIVYQFLTESLKVEPHHIRVYFSGAKGYHLMVDAHATGLKPRTDLHELYRRFADGMAELTKHKTLDTKIYNPRRAFRIPGTIHQKTGLTKEEVNITDFKPYTSKVCPGCSSSHNKLNEALERIDTRIKEELEEKSRFPYEFLENPLDCIKHVMDKGLPEGMRNDGLYTLSLYWKGCGLTQSETIDRIKASEFNRSCNLQRVEPTVESAFNSDHRFGLKDNVLSPFATTQDYERWSNLKVEESYASMGDIANEVLDDINKGSGLVARYHIPALDAQFGGISRGEFIILGGSTGTGKTEFAFNVARANAKAGVPTAFISLEIPNRDLLRRIIASESNIDHKKFWSGELTPAERGRIAATASKLSSSNYPLYFRKRKSMMNPKELESFVKKMATERHVKFFIIDHLHYFGGKNENEKENVHVSNIVKSINTLCLKYDVGIICIAHFKKLPNNQYRPSHHEFRDSSAIEQEAATILILWRNLDAQGEGQNLTEVRLAKSRKDIMLNTVRLRFNKNTRTYEDAGKSKGQETFEKNQHPQEGQDKRESNGSTLAELGLSYRADEPASSKE